MFKKIGSFIAVGLLLGGVVLVNRRALRQREYAAARDLYTPVFQAISKIERPPLTLKAVGDIMLASTYPNTSRMPPGDGAVVLANVESSLKDADLTFGNLEAPLVDGGTSGKCRPGSTQCFAFATPTRYADYLAQSGFDVLSLANNHAGDFGEAGRESTRQTLENLGIAHAGSGVDDLAQTVVEARGYRVGFLAFGHNPGMLSVSDLETARDRVTALDKEVDLVVVSFHGGAEGSGHTLVPNRTEIFLGENRGNLPAFSKTVIDAGADLVLGHGPHVLRGMEVYKDRLIAYSLGNFATYGWFQLYGSTALTGILEVKLNPDGSFQGGSFASHRLAGRGIPTLDERQTAFQEILRLSKQNFPDTAPEFGQDGQILPR